MADQTPESDEEAARHWQLAQAHRLLRHARMLGNDIQALTDDGTAAN